MKATVTTVFAFTCSIAVSAVAQAQSASTIKVTPETYIRAETDRTFLNPLKQTGGMNKLFHYRKPTPLDQQTVVRMNRDTLYSIAIVDMSNGATITIPEMSEGRFASVHFVDNDHMPLVSLTPPARTQCQSREIRISRIRPEIFSEAARPGCE
jgi:hypothetical protein